MLEPSDLTVKPEEAQKHNLSNNTKGEPRSVKYEEGKGLGVTPASFSFLSFQ